MTSQTPHRAVGPAIPAPTDKDLARAGIGNWDGLIASRFTIYDVIDIAQGWREQMAGVSRGWLCWSVDPDWSLVQQKLVESVGWTPIVGFDPRVGAPPLSANAILIDFNAQTKFPVMYPHFPMEVAFVFADRLAFWHSDLLLRQDKMERYAAAFAALPDGAMSAVVPNVGLRAQVTERRKRRYWELLGCMTRGASRANFDAGCGWWLAFYLHPRVDSYEARVARMKTHWECGVGIRYWADHAGGVVHGVDERDVAEGHFTGIGRPGYVRSAGDDWRRNLPQDLNANNSLSDACDRLALEQYLR